MGTPRKLSRRQVVRGGMLVAGAALLTACGGSSLPPAPGASKPADSSAAKPAAEAPKPAAEAPKPAGAQPAAQSNVAPPTVVATATPQQSSAVATAGGPLVVWKFGGSSREVEYFPKKNDEFIQKSGIQLEYSNNDWATKREKMLASYQAKRTADVLLIDGQSIPDLAALGAIAPFEDLDKALMEKWKPLFIPEIWNSTVYNGKFYGPNPYVDMGTFLVFNRQILQDEGVKVPETWEDVREAAKKLTKPDRAGIAISATAATNDANIIEGIAYRNGGRWLDDAGKKVLIDQPGFVDALQLLVDIVKDGSVPQGITETAFSQAATLFFEQKVAMWVSLSYAQVFIQSQNRPDDFPMGMKVFPPPAKVTGAAPPASAIMTPTAAFTVSTLCQQKEKALKYVDFWQQAEVQAGWDGSVIRGRVPALKANWETETFKKYYPEWYAEYKAGKMFEGALPMPAFPGLVEAEKALSTAMQQAILGQMSAKDALAGAAKRSQGILDEFNS
jgi:multiple sugar transport system substrate-binding protein